MKDFIRSRRGAALAVLIALAASWRAGAGSSAEELPAAAPPISELRTRAELLHETLHATLQTVHHRYYREDEGLLIPAAALKVVFEELETKRNVKLRWLAVDAAAMNRDHEAKDDFEREAVKALKRGEPAYESVRDGIYRRAAAVRLSNECLKCHVPNRTSTADRMAGLVVEFPLRTSASARGRDAGR
jgi:hypothetical protein